MVQAAPLKIEIKQNNTNFVDTVMSVVTTDFLLSQNKPLKSADD
jgi:hypothetical protein